MAVPVISMLLLIGILGYTFVRGVPHVTWSFLSTVSSATKGTFGILGNIINTLYIVVITLLIATPIGVGSAVYLNGICKTGKDRQTDRFYNGNTFRHPFYYIWTFWNGIFWKYTGTGIFYSYRFPDTYFNDSAIDHQNHPGSLKNRSGQLPSRRTGNWCNQVVYDPHDSCCQVPCRAFLQVLSWLSAVS